MHCDDKMQIENVVMMMMITMLVGVPVCFCDEEDDGEDDDGALHAPP